MNRQASLQLESLESRETPSATPLFESRFVPPGVIRGLIRNPIRRWCTSLGRRASPFCRQV